MKINIYEKAAILRGLIEIRSGKIGKAILEKIDIDKLIEKVKRG